MSRAKPATKDAPPKFESITMPEMVELWPNSPEGQLCARLAQRHLLTKLVENASKALCTPELAQAEIATCRALSKLTLDFGGLPTTQRPPSPIVSMQQLNRFKSKPQPEKPPEKS